MHLILDYADIILSICFAYIYEFDLKAFTI